LRLNDHKCMVCGAVKEFYGEPDENCDKCGSNTWNLIFTQAPQIRTQHASVLPKLDEVNAKIREETMYEEPDNSYDGDKW
jgi:predicted  nucleic acid-binding Zn-ribbon protein